MLFACNRHSLASALHLLLIFAPERIRSSTIINSSKATPTLNVGPTCEARTINYITDSLPQLCFKSSWSANAGAVKTVSGEGRGSGEKEAADTLSMIHSSVLEAETTQTGTVNGTPVSESIATATNSSPPTPKETVLEDEASELDEGSFLSFEDWKKQALEKAGQQSANIGSKKPSGENRRKDLDHPPDSYGPFGEDGEIDIDFGAFRGSGKEQEVSKAAEEKSAQATDEAQTVEKIEKRKEHRSKDAGKTCKERFSYASFDAGATVLKTHQGAKNSKSILIENKDSYMLSVCSTKNKFIIIELSVS